MRACVYVVTQGYQTLAEQFDFSNTVAKWGLAYICSCEAH